jgi:hypothetical protein
LLAESVLSPCGLKWHIPAQNIALQFPSSDEVVQIVQEHISGLLNDFPEITSK